MINSRRKMIALVGWGVVIAAGAAAGGFVITRRPNDALAPWERQPEIPLIEVAFLTGYSEPSAFYRAFKRWTGTPPGAWRENTINEAFL